MCPQVKLNQHLSCTEHAAQTLLKHWQKGIELVVNTTVNTQVQTPHSLNQSPASP